MGKAGARVAMPVAALPARDQRRPSSKASRPRRVGRHRGSRCVAVAGQARYGDWHRSRAARHPLRRSHHHGFLFADTL